jgi:preprotein translocase subunit SecE
MSLNTYINETRTELKHVTWPTRKQTIVYSALVIVISLLVAAYVGALDALFTEGIKLVIPAFN